MVGVAQHNLRDDKTSDLWSSGSICRPSSQSRKISIGVMVDSLGNKRSGATKVDEVTVPNQEREKSVSENVRAKNVEGIRANTIEKQTEAPEQETSPWVTKRSSHKTISATANAFCAMQGFSLPSSSGRKNKQHGGQDVPTTHSVQFFAKRTSILQSVDSMQKTYDGATQKRKEGKDALADRVEEMTFATAKEVFLSGKSVTEMKTDKTENLCSGTLKVKLWEILGNVSSAKDVHPESRSPKVDVNHSTPEQYPDRMNETDLKHRQNSDTIETDSENPDHSIKRPVTRSLSRKRAPTKVHLNKAKTKPSSICKQKQQEKNIFSFVEGLSSKLQDTSNGGSSGHTRKKSERQTCRNGRRQIRFPEKDNVGKIQQKIGASETAPPDEKSSSLGVIGRFRSCLSESDKKYKPKNNIKEKNSHQSPVANKADQGDLSSPNFSGNKDQQECFANTSSKNPVDPEDNYQSPTFGIKTPIPTSFPSPLPKTNQMEQGVCSPTPAEREFSAGDILSFRNLWTSKQNCYGSDVQTKLPDDVQETKTSPCKKSAFVQEEKDADDGLTESSSEEGNSESSKEGCRERTMTSPGTGTGTAVTPKVTLKPIKRLWSYEDVKYKEFSSTPLSAKGTVGSDWIEEPPEQTQEDELARAVTLFARALKGIKNKIQLAASKKSSEVLMSVAEGIHLQLQDIDSRIQTDIEKLTSVSKSKRRRLETKFQEQQEQLTLIHEKFKEEVNQHLQDCRNTLAGLEAHQIESKGITEKQRVSHRKLLQQTDEAIEMQLNDAQSRITAIQKLARGQMLQLRYVITECLKEGILN